MTAIRAKKGNIDVPNYLSLLTSRAERQPCTCQEAHGQRHTPPAGCPACHAWSVGWVLLSDGSRLSKAVWLLALAPDSIPADP